MKSPTSVALAALLAATSAHSPGCRDETRRMSSADYLLVRQHRLWKRVGESLRSDRPNLNLLRALDVRLDDTLRRMQTKGDYTGPDKDKVLAMLRKIRAAYKAQVASKLDFSPPEVALRPGVTPEDVRRAFEGLQDDYRRLLTLAPGR